MCFFGLDADMSLAESPLSAGLSAQKKTYWLISCDRKAANLHISEIKTWMNEND